MRSAVRIGKLVGVPIEAHLSFPPVFVFVAWLLATSYFPKLAPGLPLVDRWLAALLGSLALFGSLLAHELGHATMARWFGHPVRCISLFLLGGLVEIDGSNSTPGEDFAIALAGPGISLLLGVLYALGCLVASPQQPVLWLLLLYLALSNILLSLFNLLPGYPLDGGRILQAVLWHFSGDRRRANLLASTVGVCLGGVSLLLGMCLILIGQVFEGFWFVVLGGFLLVAIFHSSTAVVGRSRATPPDE